MIRAIAFAVLLLSASTAWANQEAPKVALSAGDFAAQRAKIESDLADGKTYAEISAEDRTKVRDSLDAITDLLDGVESLDALPEDAKARVFNEQEKVNTILTAAEEDSRVVCERVQKTGSNRKTTVCATVAERRRRRENDQEDLRRLQGGQPVDQRT